MYGINFIKKNYWLLGLLILVSLQMACEKNDKLGKPVISNLRAISPAPDDSILTQVIPGQIVVVQGRNFDHAQQVFFDGYEASINPALNTNKTMVITVPSEIEFNAVSEDKLNTVELVTTHGETTFKLPVVPPAPEIDGISNEFAQEGQEITLTGSYLYTVQKVVFPGDIEVTNGFTSQNNGAALQATVPDGITPGDADSVEVVTSGGSGTHTFNNTTGIIANFEDGDPRFGWAYWAGTKANDPGKFPHNRGNYLEINPANVPLDPGDESWYNGDSRAVITDGGVSWEGIDLEGKPDDYALKFEMNYKGSWTAGTLVMCFNNDFNWLYYYAPWENTSVGLFETNGWRTITIPLNKFLDGGGTGDPGTSVEEVTGGGNTAVQIMLYNEGETAINSWDAAFDNLRIVKIK